MKYKLLRDLPFMKAGSIFGTGYWAGGGFGVDRGETHYDGGGSSHNGVFVYQQDENDILHGLIDERWGRGWIELIPESAHEVFCLYKDNKLGEDEAVNKIMALARS